MYCMSLHIARFPIVAKLTETDIMMPRVKISSSFNSVPLHVPFIALRKRFSLQEVILSLMITVDSGNVHPFLKEV